MLGSIFYGAHSNEEMVRKQILARGVKDPKVIKALLSVDRADFVPDHLKDLAYQDHPLSIGYGQTISQPYMVAWMTELLNLSDSHKVLEIGTGCGYQTAILSQIAKEVYTVEIVPELYKQAKERLEDLGFTNIHFKLGDGSKGWKEFAPYHRIIVTAAAEHIPPALMEQLYEGGIMVIPVGKHHQTQKLIRVTKRKDGNIMEDLGYVAFVPLVED